MHKTTLLIAFAPAILAFGSCQDDDRYVGSDRLATETRPVLDFNEIRVGDAIAVEVSAAPRFLVTVRGNDNLMDRIVTDVQGDRLRIHMLPGNYRELDVTVAIEMPELNALDLSGASEGRLTGLPSGADEFVLELSGASTATAENASATDLILGLSGASVASLYDLEVSVAEVNLSGASEASVRIADRITGSLSGASTLHYRGEPDISVTTSGASELHNDN
ncbi:putative autotransporter adhesin-like protein [Neolewinella xylanilytica]|uniref:Putative autotransporter adhesin-like protein n=1 Tax=Neolewinella xylanilytica TaxID=1514080 RepID=A0A2S6I6Y2_9BACT|nr:DUF2807 domain-containing protein [Neolewinella xylanilytica]PPK87272.1 putative autotransporter adhesin-like protein [Neolewinella xylanilytica]